MKCLSKIELELVEQLIHQLIALDDPEKYIFLKQLDLQTTLTSSHVERRYLISLLEPI